jgi:hypothetical protein
MLRIKFSLLYLKIRAISYHRNDEHLLCLSLAYASFIAFYSSSTRASWQSIENLQDASGAGFAANPLDQPAP